jgi:phosphatidate cytidylyltransferase
MTDESRFSHLRERSFLGIIASIITILAIWFSHTPFGGHFFLFILILAQGIALWEYYRLAKAKGFHPQVWLGITFSSCYIGSHFYSAACPDTYFFTEFLLYLFVIISFVSHFSRPKDALGNLGITFFGFFYITFPMSLLIDLNWNICESPCSRNSLWLLFAIATPKICDTGAYFIGKRFGKRLMSPVISPKKTVEGLFGGIGASLLFGILFYMFCHLFRSPPCPPLSFLSFVFLTLIVAIAAVIGDLAESLLKRDAQVKDSNIIPGFGGILDMLDSLLLAIPLVYLYLRCELTL